MSQILPYGIFRNGTDLLVQGVTKIHPDVRSLCPHELFLVPCQGSEREIQSTQQHLYRTISSKLKKVI